MNDLLEPGTYYFKVAPEESDAPYGTNTALIKSAVEASSLAGAMVYEKHDDFTSTADTEFAYNATVKAAEGQGNVAGEKTVCFNAVATKVADA